MTKKLSSGVTTPRQPIQVLSQHNLPNHPSLVRKEEEGGVILINHSSNDGGNKDSYKETSSNSKDYHGNIGNIHNNSTTATAAEEWTEKDREQVQTHSKLEGLLGSVIKSYTIVELRYGAQRYNFAYCKYCEEKGRVIRFCLCEAFRIVNSNSMFHWRKQIVKRWYEVYDEDTNILHRHNRKFKEAAA